MKRIFSLVICLLLSWSLFACEKEAPKDEPTVPSQSEFVDESQPDGQKVPDQTEQNQSAPPETQPQETQPQETKLVETKPQEVKPTETEPTETKPPQTQSHVHDWTNAYQAATCDKEGYMRVVCSCGQIQNEAILAKTSHSWKNATCAAPKTCQNCGLTEGSALEHQWTEANYARPKTCKSCQATDGTALAAPQIHVNATFPEDYYYYSRSFTVSNCQVSFGTDTLGTARYIRISMDVTRGKDNTPTDGSLALKVNVYDSQNKLVKQDSIWSDDLATGVTGVMTASIPIPKTSQSDSYTISFEESY